MAVVAQLVRVPDCGSVGRRFESDLPPERDAKSCVSFFVIRIDSAAENPARMTKTGKRQPPKRMPSLHVEIANS